MRSSAVRFNTFQQLSKRCADLSNPYLDTGFSPRHRRCAPRRSASILPQTSSASDKVKWSRTVVATIRSTPSSGNSMSQTSVWRVWIGGAVVEGLFGLRRPPSSIGLIDAYCSTQERREAYFFAASQCLIHSRQASAQALQAGS